MAKKALSKASWRTLARRAGAASPPLAKKLRAKAATLRRADRAAKKKPKKAARRIPAAAVRAAKGWATRAKAMREDRGVGTLLGGINREPTLAWQVNSRAVADTSTRGLPGQGELVGGAFSKLADSIAKLARKKGGTDAIQNELASLASSSKYEGSVEADKAATKRLIEVQQIIADRIVCGFLAEIEHTMNFHRGLPPGMVHTIDSFTITKIIDALNVAGYSARGKRVENEKSSS